MQTAEPPQAKNNHKHKPMMHPSGRHCLLLLKLSHPGAQLGNLPAQLAVGLLLLLKAILQLLLVFPQLLQSHWGQQWAAVTHLIQLPPHRGCLLQVSWNIILDAVPEQDSKNNSYTRPTAAKPAVPGWPMICSS
jgi:hypothetical protein